MVKFFLKLTFIMAISLWLLLSMSHQVASWLVWRNFGAIVRGTEKLEFPSNDGLGEIYSELRSQNLASGKVLTFQQSNIGFYGGCKWIRHIDPTLVDLYGISDSEQFHQYLQKSGIALIAVPHHLPVTIRRSKIREFLGDTSIVRPVATGGGWRLFRVMPVRIGLSEVPIAELSEELVVRRIAEQKPAKKSVFKISEQIRRWGLNVKEHVDSVKLHLPQEARKAIEDYRKFRKRVYHYYDMAVLREGGMNEGLILVVEGNLRGPKRVRLTANTFDANLDLITTQMVWEGVGVEGVHEFRSLIYVEKEAEYLQLISDAASSEFSKVEINVFEAIPERE
ncbi:hypothetical protein VSU19_21565 [Verrucomicrobiales bacterium BCK34]|nr:hypothetical protein [Verrucomicrobiales bacterium BCK34]